MLILSTRDSVSKSREKVPEVHLYLEPRSQWN